MFGKLITKMTALVVGTCMLMTACNTGGRSESDADGDSGQVQATEQPFVVTYSNLVGDVEKQEVATALKNSGITDEQVNTIFAWSDDFNARVTKPKLPEGFVPMKKAAIDYRKLLFDLKEMEDGSIFPEPNCRLSAYKLLKNHISTNGTTDESDTYLMFDIMEIDTYDEYKMTEHERTNFIVLYNWISVKGAEDEAEYVQRIQQAWQDRGITVDGSTGLSLINVYLHAPEDDICFVGHTGVLVDLGDYLMLVEKYGPEGPYVVAKFKDRQRLKEYLLARPDIWGDGSEMPPVVMENDKLL